MVLYCKLLVCSLGTRGRSTTDCSGHRGDLMAIRRTGARRLMFTRFSPVMWSWNMDSAAWRTWRSSDEAEKIKALSMVNFSVSEGSNDQLMRFKILCTSCVLKRSRPGIIEGSKAKASITAVMVESTVNQTK